MVSYFHEKRFPRTCRDVITIDPIRNCGFVLFINCLFRALRGFSFRTCMVKCVLFLDVASRIDHDILLYVLQLQMIPISTHTILLMSYASCKNPLFSLANIFPIAQAVQLIYSWLTIWWQQFGLVFLTENLIQIFS